MFSFGRLSGEKGKKKLSSNQPRVSTLGGGTSARGLPKNEISNRLARSFGGALDSLGLPALA